MYDIIFREGNKNLTELEIINQKIEDCRSIMASYQNELWQKLKKELIF